jgi:uncharacterized protein (TIGR02001 family)
MSSPGADRIISIVGAGLCWALFSSPTHAQDSWGGSLAITNDYRVRGISQTRGAPALQGGLHARWNDAWIAGIWASTIDRTRGPSATTEVDAYLGFAWQLVPDWDARLTYTHYWYPNDPARVRYDYDEVSASITWRGQIAATVSWSPNTAYFGYDEYRWSAQRAASMSYELTALQPLTASLSLVAGVGYNDLQRLFGYGYWYWNAGFSYSMGPVRLDIARIDTDATAEHLFGSTATDAGWTAALSWRF